MQGLGGIAIETPATAPVLPAAEADTVFTPFADRAAAYKPVATDPQTSVLVFKQPVRGLAASAPVEFRGIPIGEVVHVSAQVRALATVSADIAASIRAAAASTPRKR